MDAAHRTVESLIHQWVLNQEKQKKDVDSLMCRLGSYSLDRHRFFNRLTASTDLQSQEQDNS